MCSNGECPKDIMRMLARYLIEGANTIADISQLALVCKVWHVEVLSVYRTNMSVWYLDSMYYGRFDTYPKSDLSVDDVMALICRKSPKLVGVKVMDDVNKVLGRYSTLVSWWDEESDFSVDVWPFDFDPTIGGYKKFKVVHCGCVIVWEFSRELIMYGVGECYHTWTEKCGYGCKCRGKKGVDVALSALLGVFPELKEAIATENISGEVRALWLDQPTSGFRG